jgi:uncharacterized protein (DUF58 family)
MFLVSAILFNFLILTFTGLLFLFLFIEAIAFHGSVGVAKECLTVKSEPQTITCTIGRTTEVQDVISNPSNRDFRIAGLFLPGQAQSPDQRLSSEEFLLKKHEKRVIRSRFECGVLGRFDIQALKVNLTSRMNLFAQAVWAPCKLTVIARPIVNSSRLASIDSSFLDDLTSDRIRRGAGTDLAGVKPSAFAEDLHRVDWKATARTGKLMVKEFYLERQPPIMLLIDSSRTEKGESVLNQLLAGLPNLLTSFKPATPIGLTLYDEKSVVTSIPPRVGEHQRELILDTLLNRTRRELTSRFNFHAVKDASLKGTTVAASIEQYQTGQRFNPVFARLLSFYRDARVRHRETLREQGAFVALAHLGRLSDPSLVIVITDHKTNLNGLIEGARTATIWGHRVILVLIDNYQKIPTSYIFPRLRDIGIRLQECSPEELPAIIEIEIESISRQRRIPADQGIRVSGSEIGLSYRLRTDGSNLI